MNSHRILDVFRPYQPLLHVLTIYDSRHFHDVGRRIPNVCYAFAFSVFMFGLFVLILGDAWYCIGYKFNLSEIALPFGIMISAVQMSITYVAIRFQYQHLENAIASLRETIQRCERTCFNCLWRDLTKFSLFALAGCQLSAKSFAKYTKVEEAFATLTTYLTESLAFITVLFFIISALIPVSYVIFHYPQPHQWQTIFGYRWAFTIFDWYLVGYNKKLSFFEKQYFFLFLKIIEILFLFILRI